MYACKIPIPALAMVDDLALTFELNTIQGINDNIKTNDQK